jgi:hypothetical protein
VALLTAAKDLPASKVELGDDAEVVLRARADHAAATGEPRRALEIYRDLLTRIEASDPAPETDLQQANGLSRIYRAMAQAAREAQDAHEAQTLDDRRTQLWRVWDRNLPGNVYVQRQLAASMPR